MTIAVQPRDVARRTKVVSLYARGFTMREVGEMVGVSSQRVDQILKSEGVPRRKRTRTSDAAMLREAEARVRREARRRRNERIIELYHSGWTQYGIADELGIKRSTVFHVLRRAGL